MIKGYSCLVLMVLVATTVAGQWVRPSASGSWSSSPIQMFTLFGDVNVTNATWAEWFCLREDCISAWPASGADGNNYTTSISFNNTGNIYQLNLERTTMTNLSAQFTITYTETHTNLTQNNTCDWSLDLINIPAGFADGFDNVSSSSTYWANSTTPVSGTNTSGDVFSIWEMEDGASYNMTEAAGANPLTVVVNFTGVGNFSKIYLRYWYEGGNGHEIELQLYDFPDVAYESGYLEITDTDGWVTSVVDVLDADDHINLSNVSVRFYHVQNGITSHHFYLDYIALVDGSFGMTSGSHDALGGRDSPENHPWALARDGSQNMTADWFAGHIELTVDDLNGSLHCSNVTDATSNLCTITDSNAGTLCAGTTTYLDGEGNCDDISGVYWDGCSDAAGCGYLTVEADPQVDTINVAQFCRGDALGTAIDCDVAAFSDTYNSTADMRAAINLSAINLGNAYNTTRFNITTNSSAYVQSDVRLYLGTMQMMYNSTTGAVEIW